MTADAATTAVRPPAPEVLPRFDRAERIVHWTTAGLFGVLMVTGAALYAGPISTLVGRRELIRTIHVVAGVSLPIPILVGLVGRWGSALRLDLGRLNRWRAADRAWLRKSKRAAARLGKFNPGQKLNAVFLGAAILVMLGSGSIMKWFSLFPLEWRTGATFVHDWFALGIWLSIAGHIFLALRDPDALEGMKRGVVTRRWARTKRPLWYEEVTGEPAQPVAESTPPL